MAISFRAELVEVSRKDWGWLIVWSVDEDFAAERYLMLQRADKPTEQEVRFGMEGVYSECCGQGWSWYGHIISFELLRDRVRAQLDAEAAQRMRDDGRIEVTFDLSSEEFATLQSALSQIFDGCGCYKIAAQLAKACPKRAEFWTALSVGFRRRVREVDVVPREDRISILSPKTGLERRQ